MIFRAAMLGLSGARPETIVRNLPWIFDCIIELLVQPPRLSGHTLNVGHTCFEALCLLLEKISVSSFLFANSLKKISLYITI